MLTDINLPIYDMAIPSRAQALAKNDWRNSGGTLWQKDKPASYEMFFVCMFIWQYMFVTAWYSGLGNNWVITKYV